MLVMSFEKATLQWFHNSAIMASVLLALVSVGLTVSYVVLIHSLCTYFREQMKQEITRLTLLFATFVLAYVLRFIYQIGLSLKVYYHVVPDLVSRWFIMLMLPLVWDLTTIISILILHCKSFRRESAKDRRPSTVQNTDV